MSERRAITAQGQDLLLLELMDFVVDPANQRLIGNPARGGQWTLELY